MKLTEKEKAEISLMVSAEIKADLTLLRDVPESGPIDPEKWADALLDEWFFEIEPDDIEWMEEAEALIHRLYREALEGKNEIPT